MPKAINTTYVLDICVGIVSHGQDHVWRRTFTIDPSKVERKGGIFQEPHKIPSSGLILNSLNTVPLQHSGLTLGDMVSFGEYRLSDAQEDNKSGNGVQTLYKMNINDLSTPMKLLNSTPRFFRVDVHKEKPRRHPYHQRKPKIHNICGSMELSDLNNVFGGGSCTQKQTQRQCGSGTQGLHHVMHTKVTCFGPSVDIYTVNGTATFRKRPECSDTTMFFKVSPATMICKYIAVGESIM